MVLVRCHNKSYNVSVAPMADVDAVVGMVARLALPAHDLANLFDTSAARLLVSDKGKAGAFKELERGVPWRFLNVPSGASLTLITGLERVLGTDATAAKPADQPVGGRTIDRTASKVAAVATAPSPPPAAATAPSSAVVAEISADDMFLFDPRSLGASGAWDDAVDYEVTQRDAMVMQSSLTKNTQALHSGRLMTQKMRDEERRQKITSLSKVRIRIEFEGSAVENLALQFYIPAAATLGEYVSKPARPLACAESHPRLLARRLHDIIRLKVLKSELINYTLIDRLPPRKQIPRTATSVYEAGMWPAARLVLSLDGPDACGDVFSESLVRRKGVMPPQSNTTALLPSQEGALAAPDAKRSASQADGREPSVPKWFKK